MQYDPFQKRAIAAIDAEKSVLVSAPTGSGKTAIAEYAIEKALSRNERVIYTAPIKALSNQKYRDFNKRYPDQAGLLTGDVSLNAHAPILIMTTEIYRNQLFEDPERLRDVSWVIFDEVHYLDDLERGTVWEEAIMFSPPHARLLALSATAPNIEELAAWIRTILNHDIEVVVETHRPVPLAHHFQCQGQIFEDALLLKKQGYLDRDRWPSTFHDFSRRRHGRGHPMQQLRARPNRTDDLIRHLQQKDRLPCLYFAFGRKRTEELAWEHERFDFLDENEKKEVEDLYVGLCRQLDLTHEPSAVEMKKLVRHGIAFHHAGMLPTLKEVIEQLFTSKLIKLIFTTETFALGINMPAKSVVFDELRKFYGTHFAFLRTRDYYQMAGRAGRRGMDTEGFVISRINPHLIPHSTILRILFGKPEPIESQFNSCYATLLNLYSQLGDRLLDVYPRSLHYFQSNKKNRQRATDALRNKIALLSDLGYLRNGKLTQKGEFASWMYGYELLLSEMMENRSLEAFGETGLSVLLAALVFEPRRNATPPKLSGQLSAIERQALRTMRFVHGKEQRHRIYPYTKPPHFHLAGALEAWIRGMEFKDLGRFTDIDEGEIIRYFRMTLQLLRQIRQAPQVPPALRAVSAGAVQKINRDLVDAEKQLRKI